MFILIMGLLGIFAILYLVFIILGVIILVGCTVEKLIDKTDGVFTKLSIILNDFW